MSLKERIDSDVKDAMRARARERLAVLRLITAAIKQREVDERITLDDEHVLAVLERMVKQRRESIVHFEKGARADLVAQECAEIEIIKSYLPEPMGDAEVAELVKQAIDATGASTMRDMGRVMSWIKPKAQGRVDMGAVSAVVKGHLSAAR